MMETKRIAFTAEHQLLLLILVVVFAGVYRILVLVIERRSNELQRTNALDHDAKVRQIAVEVNHFYRRNEQFRIYHGSTSSTRPMLLHRDRVVNTSSLSQVLHIDQESRTIIVEANVTIYELVTVALSHGLLPKVVMEFPDVTIGGAFSSASGESSCFRYGLFEQTIDWIEIVLGSGEVVTASPHDREDLFYGAAGTYGTLGVLTALRVQCIPAKQFVELTFTNCRTKDVALLEIERQAANPGNDYVDGIVFGPDHAVVMVGRLIDAVDANAQTTTFTRRHDPWFYMYAATAGGSQTVIPIVDYLFRYNRGAFWGGQAGLTYFGLPLTNWTRWLLDSLLRATPLTYIIHTARLAKSVIVQDLAVPIETAGALLDYIDREVGFYPIWLCPVTNLYHDQATFISGAKSSAIKRPHKLLDVGLYGPLYYSEEAFRQVSCGIENKLHALGGQKGLFSISYYDINRFWSIYNRQWYDTLRAKYHASTLPTILEKIQVGPSKSTEPEDTSFRGAITTWFWRTRPLPGIYGALRWMAGLDHLLISDQPRRHSLNNLDLNLEGSSHPEQKQG